MVKYKDYDDECLPVVIEHFVEFFQATPEFHYHRDTKSLSDVIFGWFVLCMVFCIMIFMPFEAVDKFLITLGHCRPSRAETGPSSRSPMSAAMKCFHDGDDGRGMMMMVK